MIFDTDVLIFIQRGNDKAANLVEKCTNRCISIITYMELLQCAPNKQAHTLTHRFLHDFSFHTLPMNERIGSRAAFYIEEYSLSHHMRMADALIAASAVEYGIELCSANEKHFKAIKELTYQKFKP